ncbi:hypothetical protein FEK42_01170 [Escherichia sp. E2748]|nr:hypothetical protein CRI64_13970 [Escherichia sp. E2748]TGC17253.1 hypothetical protein CQJ28_12065 [Escherichia sp. E2562]TLI83323.1 hypothetical protein FEK43_10525 [Escherichia sp. E2562]TLI92240.1 hypothetical protein FEK42_01170 [Escherichia sp. E2748]
MTIAERLRQEGHQIGWQQGKLEGLQEGMHEQAIKIALRMLEQGIDRDLVLATTQLNEADLTVKNH